MKKSLLSFLLLLSCVGVLAADISAAYADTNEEYYSAEDILAREANMHPAERVLHILFTPRYFEPHSAHFFQDPGVMWVIVAANIFTFVAYTLIPLALLYFVWKRRDLIFSNIFWLFGAFIVLCGGHHLLHVITFWYPLYYLQAIVDSVMAAVSVATFIAMIPILPIALGLRSPLELERLNRQLELEVVSRKQAEADLRSSHATLEENNKTLEDALRKAKENSEQLEKMNKMMVGRELQMAELKKQIKQEGEATQS